MSSAILMAGYNNKREVKKYSRLVADHYGERFIETGYKPLREFKSIKNGREEQKPLIQYALETLSDCEGIDEVVIVGHQMLLEQRLGNFMSDYQKPIVIVNQNSKIPSDVQKRFQIKPRKVKYSSIGGNLIKGYVASAAFHDQQHALFVATDSPLMTKDFVASFLDIAEGLRKEASIIFPIVPVSGTRDKLGRYPVRLLNDTPFPLSYPQDPNGRQGFRLSSLMYVNPFRFDVNTVNTAYSLRKCLSPKVQIRLFRITRSLGYPNVYSKYFIKKDLSVREVENITSEFFHGRLRLIPMLGEETSYDYDGTELEYVLISEMLKS